MLKLNSISASVLNAEGVENDTVKYVNSADEARTITRKEVVSTGRLVVCEFIGDKVNHRKDTIEKYNSRIKDKPYDYATLSKKHTEKKLMYCASLYNKMFNLGEIHSFEDVKKNSAIYANDGIFLRMMAAIDREIITPLFFSVIDAVGGGLAQIETVGFGMTKQIDIRSNDVFRFEDGSWGSGRSTSKNYLYGVTITLTPKMYTSNATIKWFQDVVNGDAGWYYAAIINGMYNKMYAKIISLMKTATEDTKYVPAGLTADTYSTEQWITITDLVAAANGVTVNDLLAIGTRSALSNLLPVDGEGGAITGLQYGLGEAWFMNGYLPKAAGVDLFPVSPVIVPGTQNSSLDTIDTGDNIYILAKGAYRPIYGVTYEGSPITLTATPGGGNGEAQGTADFTIDINVGATFDFAPVFATKVGVIQSVYHTSGG